MIRLYSQLSKPFAMQTYDATQAQSALADLPGWSFHNDGIEKSYQFADFVEAWGFMSRAAILAEKANHHPEWANVYNKVQVRLSTHDAGGLTDKDLNLAKQMEALVAAK
mgnify:CR=1 FL=1